MPLKTPWHPHPSSVHLGCPWFVRLRQVDDEGHAAGANDVVVAQEVVPLAVYICAHVCAFIERPTPGHLLDHVAKLGAVETVSQGLELGELCKLPGERRLRPGC